MPRRTPEPPAVAVHDILGWPQQVAAALETKRATGATVEVVGGQRLADGRVLVQVAMTEPSYPPPAEDLPPVSARTGRRTSVAARVWRFVVRVLPKPPEDYMEEGEEIRIRTRRHWFLLFQGLFRRGKLPIEMTAILIVLKMSAPVWIQIILTIGTLMHQSYLFSAWWFDRVLVTNKRVVRVSGVFSRRLEVINTSRSPNLLFEQSVLGNLFGYGTLWIGTQLVTRKNDDDGCAQQMITFVPESACRSVMVKDRTAKVPRAA